MIAAKTPPDQRRNGKPRHASVLVRHLRPAPENDLLYRPFDPVGNPEDRDMVASVRRHGILTPLAVTSDSVVVSGHRRRGAAIAAELDVVPCYILPYQYGDDRLTALLAEFNRQRTKTLDEVLREEIARLNPDEAYQALCTARAERSGDVLPLETVSLRDARRRDRISAAKRPFMNAILEVMDSRKKFWPLADRAIHYAIFNLNALPLIHASKADSVYQNTKACYNRLVELLTRMRIEGIIPMDSICDETRPVLTWPTYPSAESYVAAQFNNFLRTYWRDLQQSQPNHIEIVGEKLSLRGSIRAIASEYTIPVTLGRGYCSLPPRAAMVERFRRSGKDALVLLILSDFDPDGESICESFARSIRDDFGVGSVHAVKVALTYEQTQTMDLPPAMDAKVTSRQYARFAKQYGSNDVWEIDTLKPEVQQQLLRDAILEVLDVDAYNQEVEAEREEAMFLAEKRLRALRGMEADE